VSVVIANAPPDAFDAAIAPVAPVERLDDVQCDARTQPTDPDGDAVALRATWTVNGEAYIGATDGPVSGGTIAAASTLVRDIWVCTLVADDRHGGATAAVPVHAAVGSRILVETVSAPPGSFYRGASTYEASLGIAIPPRHPVTLTRPFEIGRYEVTREEWEAIMASDPSQPVEGCDGRCPVTRVSWHDAAAFADALSASAGLPACYGCVRGEDRWTCREEFEPYPCRGYRLPTAAEWEYAARDLGTVDASLPLGGDLVSTENETCDDSMYVGGVPASEQGVVCAARPERVGGRRPNRLGLYDIIGNVGEWTHDQQTAAPPPSPDPYGTGSGGFYYVVKGGSYNTSSLWNSLGVDLSSDERGQGAGLGLRIARTLPRAPSSSSPLVQWSAP
jgi:formylglycine-generating enzyme required for sulfatase activity